jgi:hypothetical protein
MFTDLNFWIFCVIALSCIILVKKSQTRAKRKDKLKKDFVTIMSKRANLLLQLAADLADDDTKYEVESFFMIQVLANQLMAHDMTRYSYLAVVFGHLNPIAAQDKLLREMIAKGIHRILCGLEDNPSEELDVSNYVSIIQTVITNAPMEDLMAEFGERIAIQRQRGPYLAVSIIQ